MNIHYTRKPYPASFGGYHKTRTIHGVSCKRFSPNYDMILGVFFRVSCILDIYLILLSIHPKSTEIAQSLNFEYLYKSAKKSCELLGFIE
jgi:hypothetical protein